MTKRKWEVAEGETKRQRCSDNRHAVHSRDNRAHYGIMPANIHTVDTDANSIRWCNIASIISHQNILKVYGSCHVDGSRMTVYTEVFDSNLAEWLEKNADSLVDQYKRPTAKLQNILLGTLLGLQALEGIGNHLSLSISSICIKEDSVKLGFLGSMEGLQRKGVPRRDVDAFRKVVFQIFKGSPPIEVVHLCWYLCENSHIPTFINWHPSLLLPCERNSLRMRSYLYLVQKFELHGGFKGFLPGLDAIYTSPTTAWYKEFKKWKSTVDPQVDWISVVRREGTFVEALQGRFYQFWNPMSYLRFSNNVIKHCMNQIELTEAEMDNYLNYFFPDFMVCCFPWVHSFLEEVERKQWPGPVQTFWRP